jgi:siroheme synthase-like protein
LLPITISEEIKDLAVHYQNISLYEKGFDPADLEGVELVVCAVNDVDTSACIRAAAKERRLLVNVADKPELCDFYLGSVVRKGTLKIAISTNGQSPTTAKRLKEVLQEAIPDKIDEVIGNLNTIRNGLTGDFTAKVNRLNEITQVLVKDEPVDNRASKTKRIATYALLAFGFMLIGHFILSYVTYAKHGKRCERLVRNTGQELSLDGIGWFFGAAGRWRIGHGLWRYQCYHIIVSGY